MSGSNQIDEMSRDIETSMRAQKFPVRVIYGPESFERVGYDSGVIVVERDRTGGDTITAAPGYERNPRKMRVRNVGVVATIYAASTVEGARLTDHEALCDQYVDGFLIALAEWVVEGRAGTDAPISEARYLRADERNAEQTWPGVAFRVRFRVARGVKRIDFQGDARPAAAVQGFANTTIATGPGFPAGETGCGA